MDRRLYLKNACHGGNDKSMSRKSSSCVTIKIMTKTKTLKTMRANPTPIGRTVGLEIWERLELVVSENSMTLVDRNPTGGF